MSGVSLNRKTTSQQREPNPTLVNKTHGNFDKDKNENATYLGSLNSLKGKS